MTPIRRHGAEINNSPGLGLKTAPEKVVKERLWWQRDWFFLFAVLVITVVVYQPAWNGKPIWDDDTYMTPQGLRAFSGLSKIWLQPGATSQYYPLTYSAFWVEYRLWDELPLGYHLVNILLHAISALLLLRILRRLEVPGARLAVMLFALHPVQAESVAWISELKNTLSGVFFLGAALVYFDFRFDPRRRWIVYAFALGLFILGLLSKTVVAVLPAALLVVLWWKWGKFSWKRDILPLLPFFAAGMSFGILSAWMERKFVGAVGPEFEISPIERGLIAGRAVWFYLSKLVWPYPLSFVYPRWEISQTIWWEYLFPAGALGLLIGLWWVRKKFRGPLAAFLLFSGTLFPVLGFLNVYPFRYSFVADHFQYLACIAPLALASAGASVAFGWIRESSARMIQRIGVVLIFAVLGTRTWQQAGMYADMETLWRTTIAQNPRAAMAYNNLGLLLFQYDQVDEAMSNFQKAVEIQPNNPEMNDNLGTALHYKHRLDDAIVHFRKAVEFRPDIAIYQGNLGSALFEAGQLQEAVRHYGNALELQPDNAVLANNLAWILATSPDSSIRNGSKAVELGQQAVRLTGGNNPITTGTLAAAYAESGRFDEAVAAGEKARNLAIERRMRNIVDLNSKLLEFYRARRPYHGE